MAQIPRTARKYAASSRFHNACLPRPPAAPGSGRFGAALLFMAALLITPLFAHAAVIHVDTGAAGADNGSSWSDAYTDLQDALAGAVSGDEIWVAAGLYMPTDGTDRTASFQLKNGVGIYGGFAGTETQRDQRAPEANVTVLSGDIDGNDTTDSNGVVVDATDIAGSNSYHVVTGSGVDGTAVLDGFTITAGNATSSNNSGGGMYNDSGSPTLANLVFSGNSADFDGGGMVNYSSSPVLTNVTFSGNRAQYGGGMENSSSSNPVLSNVVFSGNSASQDGGGMENFGGNPALTNVTFSGNSASDSGGGMANLFSSAPDIRNTIFWNNQDSTGTGTAAASIFISSGTTTISYSLVQGCHSGGTWNSDCGTDSGNNLTDADPLFVNTPDPNAAPTATGNLRLQAGSPALDAGNNAVVTATTDLAGNPRIVNTTVDLGPYERPSSSCPTGGVIHVDRQATESGDGVSWTSAYRDLQDALAVTEPCEIWVAGGVYKPTDGTDRTATFQLKNDVEIYGGFAGTETQRDQRAPEANVTVLSGDIDGNDTTDGNGVVVDATGIAGSNSYHVVTGSGVGGTAVLDGFTITAGNADETTFPNGSGGGMLNDSGSPTLANLVFSGNSADFDGGGMVNYSSSPVLTNVTFSGNSARFGGGMENSSSANPVLSNVVFSGNSASQNGGGMENFGGNPALTNVTFSGNSANSSGGGMFNSGSSPVLTNVTFSGNSASSSGGGMVNNNSSTSDIRNSIFWHNKDSTGTGTAAASVSNFSSSPTISYSLVQGCHSGGTWNGNCGTDSGNNLTDADPLFVNTSDPDAAPTTAGNLRLQAGSPAIDAGNDAANSTATDLDGKARIQGDAIDLGPFETLSTTCPAGGVRFVNRNATQTGGELSWDSVYRDLQDALAVTEPCEIWVAGGAYKPTDGATDRTATFQLKNGVEIYGGFAGTETQRDQRAPKANVTVLSGDIDGNDTTDGHGVVVDATGIAGSNSYHVVTGSGVDGTAVLDGFTITAGNADGIPSFVNGAGGGMYNDGGSPTLANLVFSGNSAGGGGGMFNYSSSSPVLTNVTFSGNNGRGGGMLNQVDSSPVLTNVTFSGNSAVGNGGGMSNFDSSSPVLTNVTFSGNSAISGGGMNNHNSSSPVLTNTTFSGNSADVDGGGMYSSSTSSPALTNVTFSGNSAGRFGGGMANFDSSSPVLTNVTFSGNRADLDGGGMANLNSSTPDIRNTIFWNNQDDTDTSTAAASIFNDNSTTTISYSLVQGCNSGGTWNGNCGTDSGNNLTDADPLFVNTPDPDAAPTTAGNLRLQVGSPAIDAGNEAFIDDIANATDLDGNPRKVGDAVDLGAYEYFERPDPLFHDRFEAEIP